MLQTVFAVVFIATYVVLGGRGPEDVASSADATVLCDRSLSEEPTWDCSAIGRVVDGQVYFVGCPSLECNPDTGSNCQVEYLAYRKLSCQCDNFDENLLCKSEIIVEQIYGGDDWSYSDKVDTWTCKRRSCSGICIINAAPAEGYFRFCTCN